MARTLNDIRAYIRDVLEIDDLTDAQADQHIRHAHRRVMDMEDWPFLIQRRVFSMEKTADDRAVYPIQGAEIRRVKSVFLLDETGREERELGYTPHEVALSSGGWQQANNYAEAWSYQRQPIIDGSLEALEGVIYVWPAQDPPLPHISAQVVQEAAAWPVTTTSSNSVPNAGETNLPPGMVTAMEFFSIAEASAQLAETRMVQIYMTMGEEQMMKVRGTMFPTANIPITLGGLSRGRRARRNRGGSGFSRYQVVN